MAAELGRQIFVKYMENQVKLPANRQSATTGITGGRWFDAPKRVDGTF